MRGAGGGPFPPGARRGGAGASDTAPAPLARRRFRGAGSPQSKRIVHHSSTTVPERQRRGASAMIQKKVCMVGVFATGKTSLVQRFVHSLFSTKYHSTVGVKIDRKQVQVGT